MKAQTAVDFEMIKERIRDSEKPFEVATGPGFGSELAKKLNMPEFEPDELADALYELVNNGEVRANDCSLMLGGGGTTNEPVEEDALRFSVIL